MTALGESIQDQGGVLFLAAGKGVICQNAADAPDSPEGLALASGQVGTDPIEADDPDDRFLINRAFKNTRLAKALRFVKNGEELMNFLDNMGKYKDKEQCPRPDLILLDGGIALYP